MATNKKIEVHKHWEEPGQVSLQDENLRALETEAIVRWLTHTDCVLDLGCGDGINSLNYASKVKRLIGVDYSDGMIRRAKHRLADSNLDNIEFQNRSVEELDQITDAYDVVITQRCLINLSSIEEQSAAIAAIQRLVRPGGLYLMLECVQEGRVRLNQLRTSVGLEPLSMPWHNQFFDLEQLLPLINSYFTIEEIADFSLYFLITRLLNPLMGLDYSNSFSKQIDAVAMQLQSQLPLDQLSGIGPQRLFVLRKAGVRQ